MVPLVSVAGYISLLTEPEAELQAQALVNLNDLVDQFWMEIAEHGSIMSHSPRCQFCADGVVRCYMKMKSFRNDNWPLYFCQR
jgi:hypothetical protein